jgi:branched-chain amino acid transport system substrate-binding protein
MVFFTGYYPEAGLLLRQKREMGWNVPLLGGDGTNNTDLVKVAGKAAAEGYLCLSPPLPQDLEGSDAKAFLAGYRARYGGVPQSIWGVLAGDSLKVLARAIEVASSTDGRKIATALRDGVKDFPGLTGRISFDGKGDRVGDVLRVYRVDSAGTFVLRK